MLTTRPLHRSTIVCSIIRVKVNSDLDLKDPTWGYTGSMIWSTIEGNVGVICACLPVLAPLLRVFKGRFSFTSSSSETQSRRAYRRSVKSRLAELEDLSNFTPLEEDTSKLFPIRKTVRVETVAGGTGGDEDVFDARRPGDTQRHEIPNNLV